MTGPMMVTVSALDASHPLTELNALLVGAPTIAIVGARASTAYGNVVASEFGRSAAKAGWTLLTGGSYGIETAAVQGALAAGGKVVLALGQGARTTPVPALRTLHGAVMDAGGITISTEDEDALPSRRAFIARAELLGRLAGTCVLVESAWRSSALATMAAALESGSQCLAVPGPVTSAVSFGPHLLLREGKARLVTRFEDIDGEGPRRTLAIA